MTTEKRSYTYLINSHSVTVKQTGARQWVWAILSNDGTVLTSDEPHKTKASAKDEAVEQAKALVDTSKRRVKGMPKPLPQVRADKLTVGDRIFVGGIFQKISRIENGASGVSLKLFAGPYGDRLIWGGACRELIRKGERYDV